MAKEKQLKVRLVRSTISQRPAKRATVRSLGLRKINSTRILPDNPSVRGMVKAVSHLVEVEEVE